MRIGSACEMGGKALRSACFYGLWLGCVTLVSVDIVKAVRLSSTLIGGTVRKRTILALKEQMALRRITEFAAILLVMLCLR